MSRENWTYLTNHGHVLVVLALQPHARVRDIAGEVGISDRAVQGILADLVDAGHVVRHREGRRNVYRVRSNRTLRHPLERGVRLGDFLSLLAAPDQP